MNAVTCPFCGVVSDAPHETQQGCIDALQTEIARTRQILEHVTEPLPPASSPEAPDPQRTHVSALHTRTTREG